MEKTTAIAIRSLTMISVLLWFLPSVGRAATIAVDCSLPGTPLQDAIDIAASRDTLNVSGTCNENVRITEQKHRITLDGQGIATINGAAGSTTVTVRGRDTTIKGFTITGGTTGIGVVRGGTARIEDNIIQNTGSDGIQVNQHSFARIIDNTIQNNPASGIQVSEGSSARIGFLSGSDTVARPNDILSNGGDGIDVRRFSSARIVGNNISNNGDDGIDVKQVSHANVSDNDIDDNADEGIAVIENSGVNLGSDTGNSIFQLPNRTNVNNADVGIRSSINSYANGRLGTLNGTSSATSFSSSSGSVNSLISLPVFTFTDDPLAARVTAIKRVHITELREAANELRALSGLGSFPFTDQTLTAGVTTVKRVHITELRTALTEAAAALGAPAPNFPTDPTIVAGQTLIKKAHIEEIRTAIKAVESILT